MRALFRGPIPLLSVLLILVLYHPSGEAAPPAPDVAGLWAGALHHNGQTTTLGLRLTAAGDTAFVVRLTLPAIDVWDLPLAIAVPDGDSLRIGGWWTLGVEGAGPSLTGTVPAALLPVYRVPFTVNPVDTIPRPAPAKDDVPTAKPVWTFKTNGPVWAGIACAGSRVYAGSDDGTLYALDAETGKPVWTFPTEGSIRARATVTDGRVLVHSDDGFLYALDAGSGKEQWRVQLESEPRKRVGPGESNSPYDHYGSSPTVAYGMIYVGAGDGGVHALDLATGDRRWRFQAGGAVDATPAVSGDRVFVSSLDGSVVALDSETGEARWTHDTGAPVAASPVVAGGRVLIGSRSYDVLALDAATGEPVWTYYVWFSWVESMAARGATAYVGTSDAQQLWAFNVDNGEPKWSVDSGGSVWADPVVGEGAVFAGSVGVPNYIVDHRGGFLAADLNGRVLWRFGAADPGNGAVWGFVSAPAVDGDKVYVGGLDGQVWAFPQMPSD